MTKIVFLDIDGVISPTENNGHEVLHPERIGHYDEQYYLEAAKKHRQKYNMSYLDSYDMYVVDTCWSTLAMQKIKNLLLATDSKIVMESSWIHSYNEKNMPGLLAMAGLKDFYLDIAYGKDKLDGITKYLNNHPEVTDFVIIDDEDYWYLAQNYGFYLVQSNDVISDEDCLMAKDILQRRYRFTILDNDIYLWYDDKKILASKYRYSHNSRGKLLLVYQVRIFNKQMIKPAIRILIKQLTKYAYDLNCDDGFVLVANREYFKRIKTDFWFVVGYQRVNINGEFLTDINEAVMVHSEYSPLEKIELWEKMRF